VTGAEQPQTAETLARLVAFKTVSRDSNEALIRDIAQTLSAYGAELRVLPGIQPGKFNLFARLGPEGTSGLILSGHSDVVPVDGQDWQTDPFSLTERDGKLHARGAVDMKGFIASAMSAAARLKPHKLRQPLYLAISHDEEIGCVGVRSMLETLAEEGFTAAGCIVGEPTGMQVASGHKNKFAGCICCKGEPAHSANPDLGCNAIHLAADMIAELRELQSWLRDHGERDAAYAVPHATLNIGTIAGGTFLNIVPERCDVTFEFRLLPGERPEPLLSRLQQAADRLAATAQAQGRHASIEIRQTGGYPALAMAEDAPLLTMTREAAGAYGECKVDFGTEAGLFAQMVALPAVVCGPGSIDRAHRPGEFITRSELDECDAFLGRLIEKLY
jgi:acetylornithine deacetylase